MWATAPARPDKPAAIILLIDVTWLKLPCRCDRCGGLSREGREYRENVCSLLAGRVGQPLSGQLQVQLDLYPSDARRRDWDNFQKGVWDSLQHAGVYLDDSQVKRAVVEMHPPSRPGHATVVIRPCA